MPYSFEGLILLIGKDRRRIHDRYLGHEFISEPEFLQEYINKELKKTVPDFLAAPSENYPEEIDEAFEDHLKMHHNHFVQQRHSKQLINSYVYYMMEFERYIHIICGKENFVPENFVSSEFKSYNDYCKNVITTDNNKEWLKKEVRAVVDQLLAERYEV